VLGYTQLPALEDFGDLGAPELALAAWASLNLTAEECHAATLYTSCESCAMCAGGQYWAGIGRLVFAVSGDQLNAILPIAVPRLVLSSRDVFGRGNVHVDVEGPLTLDEAALARAAALAAVGLTLAMESDVLEDIDAGRLVRVLEDWTPPLSPLSLYYPSRRNPTAAFKAFVDFARPQGGASGVSRLPMG
jgi:DNA-binding transcriptional LysR family regulator